jgi:hypothetical protein
MKNSFIIPHGVRAWFNVCWHMLKHVKANDMIMIQMVAFGSFFLCLFHLHYSKECVYKSTIHIAKISRKVQRTSHYVGKTSLVLCVQKIKFWTML